MGAFWFAAATMIGVALLFMLPPMLSSRRREAGSRTVLNAAIYRDRIAELETEHAAGVVSDEEYAQTQAELERAMLEDVAGDGEEQPTAVANPVVAVLVALAVPTAAFGLYLQLGSPDTLSGDIPVAGQQPAAEAGPAGQLPHSVDEMVAQLEERLRAAPDDADGWTMLGRTYAAMDRLEEARGAFERAYALRQDDPTMLVGYAETLARMNANNLAGRPTELINQALRLAPNMPRALWLGGITAFQSGDSARALELWERLRSVTTLDAEQSRLLEDFIARAREQAPAGALAGAQPQPAATATAAAPTAPAAGAASLDVKVTLAPEIADRAAPTDTLFVFARAAEGPRIPLAIVRKQVSDLPIQVTLDDSMAMMPAMRLSAFPEVVVGARISRTGNATPSSGDLSGESTRVQPGQQGPVEISISRVVP